MASGFVTNDGKDLDSRYLGINAKAASAKTADTATKANTATTATKLSSNVLKRSGAPIYFSVYENSDTSAPQAGIVATYGELTLTVAGKSVGVATYVNKGDAIRSSAHSGSGQVLLTPISTV